LDNGKIILPALPAKIINARLLDNTKIDFSTNSNRLTINVPASKQDKSITIVALEIKGNAMDIPVIPPFSKTNSLIYYKSVKASSSITPLFMHNPEAVTDDNDETFWTPGRNTTVADSIIGKRFESCHDSSNRVWLRSGWLEVSLDKITTIQSVIIKQSVDWGHAPVTMYKIECEVNGGWQEIITGTSVTGNKIVFPRPVKTKTIRLSVEASGRPAISEFQVFAD
jgi:alpha-L-fucosidase